MSQNGLIFDVQRFTIHDGPGLRTELFLKGCPLRCEWCSNPESWSREVEIGVFRKKCISKNKCGSCFETCLEEEALAYSRGKLIAIDRKKCNRCMACVEECPSEAIKLWGTEMSVSECMDIILRDKGYYDRSNGGVTISGGEPLLQSDFVAELFQECKNQGVNTCFETTLYSSWENVEKLIPYTDIFIVDIKHMDSFTHKKYTGVGNELVLSNLEKLSKRTHEIILRIPVIPNVNDTMDNIEATANFIITKLKGRIRVLQLLSFMRLGEEKYEALGLEYKMKGIHFHRKSFQIKVNKIAKYLNEKGIYCLVGTREKE